MKNVREFQLEQCAHRYFSRAVKDSREFDFVMDYIDQNPVKAGISSTPYTCNPIFYLHYSTGTADYFICEYDGQDSMFGKVRSSVYQAETTFQNLSLEELKKNPHLRLDFGWGSGT